MSNNKNKKTNAKAADVKKPETKKPAAKNPAAKKDEEVKGIKKLFSEKNLAVVITALSLVAILAVGGLIALIRYIVRDEGFDYQKSNLSKYIEFTGDYKNFTIDIDYAPMKDIDLEVAKLNLLASHKGEALYGGATKISNYIITPGAELKIWYRGYLKDSEGKKVEVTGMSNFTGSAAHDLEIGSSALIPGFELGLVGIDVDNYPKFEKITTGRAEDYENAVAYVTFTTQQNGKDVEQKGVRIDMSSEEDVDANFGAGFYHAISGMKIGVKNDKITVTKGDNEFDYTKVTVNFVTTCEVNPIVVETYFPYDYGTANLRNEKAYFEVYVDSAVLYELPEGITEEMITLGNVELSEEFIQSLIDDEESVITAELLDKYEGATLVEKYDAYATETIEAVYKEDYEQLVEDAIWKYYRSIANVKKYPKAKVEAIYKEYLADVEYQFSYTGGTLQGSNGSSQTYSDLESFACAYLGLSKSYDWRGYLNAMAESMVQERMILFYVIELEGIELSDDEFKAKYDETVKSYLDEYVNQHLAQVEKKDRDDFTDEEFEQYVLERRYELFQQYDETFFTERTYYTVLFDMVKDWPEVTTLENKSAYFDKYK